MSKITHRCNCIGSKEKTLNELIDSVNNIAAFADRENLTLLQLGLDAVNYNKLIKSTVSKKDVVIKTSYIHTYYGRVEIVKK